MTDADVDGSHIRTLLLTLFYRKMPELVMRGHIYVAQPPLYGIRKGKTERFAITEEEKLALLAELGLGATTLVHPGGKKWRGVELRRLMDTVVKLRDLEKRMPADGAVPFHAYLAEATVPDRTPPAYYVVLGGKGRFVDTEPQLAAELEKLAKTKGRPPVVYEGPDSPCRRETADVEVYVLHLANEVQSLMRRIDALGAPVDWPQPTTNSWRIETGETSASGPTAGSLLEAIALIEKTCEKDLVIQRYKGLGEMNPSQLFESTMDPARRTLKRVTVDDMVEADHIFTVLMGPEVEPRREFIEKHALEATNIDI
jgi:DNA gyrase subunit B